jgi:branched-chain amino acid transport system ATP-binding protein
VSLLRVESLDKSFNALRVLQEITLSVEAEERHVIIGPNGAGKTTLFNCVMGTIPLSSGKVLLDGKDVGGMPAHRRVPMGMSRTFQKNNLFGRLTVEENVNLAVEARKPYRFGLFKPLAWRRDLAEESEEMLRQWDMWERRDRRVDELSYGEQRLLEVMLAIASRPRVLLLDEPTSGMSPAETSQTIRLIQDLPRSLTLLVIEHDMEVVFAIADRITVLHHGEVFLSGTPDEVRGDERVSEIYFGGGAKPHA